MNRSTIIKNIQHPEWGEFVLKESNVEDMYEIRGDHGSKMLDKHEFSHFWEILK